jgi:hypothetical protein
MESTTAPAASPITAIVTISSTRVKPAFLLALPLAARRRAA